MQYHVSKKRFSRTIMIFSGDGTLHSPIPFPLCKKATIHQVTTMLVTSKDVLFPRHSHLLATRALGSVIIEVKGHQILVVSRWLWPGNKTFRSGWHGGYLVVTWWIVIFSQRFLLQKGRWNFTSGQYGCVSEHKVVHYTSEASTLETQCYEAEVAISSGKSLMWVYCNMWHYQWSDLPSYVQN